MTISKTTMCFNIGILLIVILMIAIFHISIWLIAILLIAIFHIAILLIAILLMLGGGQAHYK